jgi:Zn-dependent membrane protease YugP
MPFLLYDPTFWLLIPAMILALWAQYKVKSTFSKYNKVMAASGITGSRAAQLLLQEGDLANIQIEQVKGKLSDHYDPKSKTLRLSSAVAHSRSVAAIGVAAHEVGHAIQHQQSYTPFQIRQSIVPVAQFGTTLAFPLFFIGLLFTAPSLMDIGILLFCGAVLFQLITLPVEYNASARALVLLQSRDLLAEQEIYQTRKVLNAAALTYVAATAVSVLHLLRLILLRGMRD